MHCVVINKRISFLPGIVLLLLLFLSGLRVSAQIATAEYFWDTDPGIGLATPIYAADGNLDEAIETLLSSGVNQPAVGMHTFNIRVKDSGNFWGPVFTSVINVESTISATDKKIIQAEYFWDTDPGNGNGTTILALDGNLDEAIETLFSSSVNQPIVGMHTFNIRVKDFGNFWGPTFTSVVNIENTITATDKKVIQAECFWDADPGEGNGITILAFDGNLDEAIEILTSSSVPTLGLSLGVHVFNIRIKDHNNFWGPVFKHVVEVTDCIAPVVNLGTDRAICDGQNITLDASNHFAVYAWSTGETTQTINLSVPGTYSVAATDTLGCVRKDTIVIYPQQHVDLGNDTTICPATSLILNAGTFASYAWSTSQSSASISINPASANNYSVTVTDANGCLSADTIHVSLFPWPVVNLGNDTSLCAGETLMLNAGSFSSYLWTGGSNSQYLTVSATGTYSVTVTDGNSCHNSDNISVTFHSLPAADLGADQVICDGNPQILDAGIFSAYLWSDMSTGQTLSVSSPGIYSVTVTDENGCHGSDAIQVTASNTVNTSLAYSICQGNSYNFNGNLLTTAGIYHDTLVSVAGCDSIVTLTLTVNPLPVIDLGNDTSLCAGETLLLNAGSYSSYLWTGGSNSQYLTVSATGTYSVTVTDGNSCHNSDNISVTFHLLPAADLGPDLVICDGNPQILDAGAFSAYLWSDMSTGQTLSVSSPGIYSVTVTDGNGCHGSDAIQVTASNTVNTSLAHSICQGNSYNFNGNLLTTAGIYHDTLVSAAGCDSIVELTLTVNPLPVVNLGPDTIICIWESIVLNAGIHDSYNWSTGASSQYLLIDSTGYGAGAHLFSVIVSDNFCESSDAIVITFDPCTGLNKNEPGSVSLYPNPGNGTVFILLNNSQPEEIELSLFNPEGKLIKSWKRTFLAGIPESINFDEAARGVYYLRISGSNTTSFHKLIYD